MRNTWTGQADIQSDPRHDAGIKLRDMILAGLANGLGIERGQLDEVFERLQEVKEMDKQKVKFIGASDTQVKWGSNDGPV